MIVLGPFNVGDLLDESGEEIRGFANLGAPKRKEIIKSLNDCQAYILDQRITRPGKHAKFGEPRLLVTGKLKHVWEGNNRRFTIWITTPCAIRGRDIYQNLSATRNVTINIGIDAAGSNATERSNATIFFFPKAPIRYDIHGALRK